MGGEVLEKLQASILDLNMDAALANVRSIIDGGGAVTVRQGIDAISAALEVVGKRFQEGEWFVGELVYAGEITKTAMELLAPHLAAGSRERRGTIVVGQI